MARIAAEPAPPPPAPPAGTILRRDGRRWLRGPAPGVEVQMLLQNKTMMVRMAPGSRIPAHHHHTDEQCLVLEGSLQAGEVTATAGDFIHMPTGSDHADLVSASGCVFLIAYS
ncbi:MAG: cupin domain-containing protein [Bryobacterales bacterium]|nr:cupin domain-containing protein [Bryobacterales bacterium]